MNRCDVGDSGPSHKLTWARVVLRFRRLLPFVILIAVPVWTIFPALQQVDSAIPVQANNLTTVPLFNVWTIWWNADRALHAFSGYWDAPIFFPEPGAFAFSEPQPATVVVAPVVWLTRSPAAAYNAYLLLSLSLNAVVAYITLRRSGVSRSLATIGGIMMAMLPVGLRHMEVIQLVAVWPFLWAWDAVRRHGQAPSWRTAVESAIAGAMGFYTSIHHALFFSIVLAGTGWVLLTSIRTTRFRATTTVTAIISAVLIGIVVVPMHRSLNRQSFERSEELVARLSATGSDLFDPPNDALIRGPSRPGFQLSPGWLKMLLATAGVMLGLCRHRHRRWVLFLLLTAVASGLLSMGPNVNIGVFQPWGLIVEWIPGMSHVRNVFRFAYLMQMAIILLSVTALSELRLRLTARTGRRRVASFAVLAVGLLAIVEVPAPEVLLAGVPDLSRHYGWTEFVKHNTPQGRGIACFPFPSGTSASDFDGTTRWMCYGTLHGVPLVNGYSGFFPEAYMNLQSQVNAKGLQEETLAQLARMKTHFVLTHRNADIQSHISNTGSYELRLVFSDPVGVDVYKLVNVGEE